MRYAPWIAFALLLGIAGLVPCFIDELAWSRGVGDLVLVVFAVLTLVLIRWERGILKRLRR